jgi:hypothetical protein
VKEWERKNLADTEQKKNVFFLFLYKSEGGWCCDWKNHSMSLKWTIVYAVGEFGGKNWNILIRKLFTDYFTEHIISSEGWLYTIVVVAWLLSLF